MKTLFRLLIVILFLGGWALAALSLHVVLAKEEQIVLIPKQRLSLSDTYVDARAWTLEEAVNHPSLVRRIVQSGKAPIFSYVVGDDHRDDAAAALEEAVKNAPAKGQPTDNGKSGSVTKTAGSWWPFGK